MCNCGASQRQCAPLLDALQDTYKTIELKRLVRGAKPFTIDGRRVCPDLHIQQAFPDACKL